MEKPALEIWKESPIFKALRNRSNLKGYCASCRYRETCGGCRARALAYTGDLFVSDLCVPLYS
ncbi:MAG: hypothetical protein DSO07_09055 [Thermoproteota archaeon]|jgi:radical SAM protein with 4Fe4S-binding SPASM domain|uniref:SPASM domain-containing protein n=1 Tax=Candidatus Methanodesulfokora washburnensis TaxID=2478471 RepID=A0A3R9QWC6_9CREN|nr:SPASM domain-containing protein [Candidatus Methanodesulfokores washburnensis]RSN74954.1 SPASM domain-containing protein [Candidatus Methanodesulfokores washburnensis]RZN63508.1 MAG: SPASM domain-containing protein [Candidatus Methanodesulfokores washburnensis]TDA40494.1 MAG: hypothetical protein DSO07_09055 [Candidatus Korarchaeota archaeon]